MGGGKKKVAQLVWLEPEVMAKVLELSAKTSQAANVVISELVKKALEEGKSSIGEGKVYLCPKCGREFTKRNEALVHIFGCVR